MELEKDKKYILESNSGIQHYQYQEDIETNKRFLNGNYSENIITFNYFFDDKTQILNKDARKNEYLSGTLSKLLGIIPIYMYSDEGLLNKYPNGFYTEGLIMFPTKAYMNMIDKENQIILEKRVDLSQVLFLKTILGIIENKYGINFSQEKIEESMLSIFKRISVKSDAEAAIDIHKTIRPPSYVKHDDLIEELKNNGFREEAINLVKSTAKQNDHIDAMLFESKEINDENNLLYKIKDKVKPVTISGSLSDLNQDDYSSQDTNTIIKILNLLKQKGKSIITAQAINSTNEANVINTLDNEWLPYLMELKENNHFKIALNEFIEILHESDPQLEHNSSFKRMIINHMPKYKNFANFREIAIKSISGMWDSFEKKTYQIFEDTEYNIRKDYINACNNGDLNKIKQLVKENDIDIGLRNNEGLELVLKNGHIEIIDYFLNSKELKKNLKASQDFKKAVNYYSNEAIMYLAENNVFDKEDIKKNYAAMFSIACLNKKTSAINYLLDSIGFEEKIDAKLLALRTLCFDKSDDEKDVEIVKSIVTHINDGIKKGAVTKAELKSLPEELHKCFNGAVQSGKTEICRYFVFDFNIQVSAGYRLYLQKEEGENYKAVERFFTLRDVNKTLNRELEVNIPTKPKKSKI